MSDSFVPMGPAFTALSGNSFTPLQLKSALPAAAAAQLAGTGKASSAQNGGRNPSLPASATSSATTPPCSQPLITLRRDGDVISGIRIQCSCGQVIELDCRY
jgi:hypothetical protein